MRKLLDDLGDLHALSQQNFRLSELGDDLLRPVSLPRHRALLPSIQILVETLDRSQGDRSIDDMTCYAGPRCMRGAQRRPARQAMLRRWLAYCRLHVCSTQAFVPSLSTAAGRVSLPHPVSKGRQRPRGKPERSCSRLWGTSPTALPLLPRSRSCDRLDDNLAHRPITLPSEADQPRRRSWRSSSARGCELAADSQVAWTEPVCLVRGLGVFRSPSECWRLTQPPYSRASSTRTGG